MEYESFEARLKTDKSREYLWEKINTPEKIIALEGFPRDSTFKKISENNYELHFGKRFAFLTFIPGCGVNMNFVEDGDSSLAWFEITGEENCEIIHGTSVRMDVDCGKWLEENVEKMTSHFLDELSEIAK